MPIEFRCSNCNKLLRVGDAAAGKKAKCPQCATVLSVPAASPPPGVPSVPPEMASPPPPAPAPAAMPPPALAVGPTLSAPPVASASDDYGISIESELPSGAPPPPAGDFGVSAEPEWAPPPPLPGGSLGIRSGSRSPARSGPALDVAAAFSRAWQILKDNMAQCIVLGLIPILVIAGLNAGVWLFSYFAGSITGSAAVAWMIRLPGSLVLLVVASWFLAAQVRVFLKIARGDEAQLTELFTYDPTMLRALGAALVVNVMMNALPAFFGTIGASVASTSVALKVMLGFLSFVASIGGVFLLSMFFPALPLIFEKNVELVDAFKQSLELTKRDLIPLFLAWLAAGVGAVAVIVCTCGLGVLVAAPFLMLFYVVLYRALLREPAGEQPPPQ